MGDEAATHGGEQYGIAPVQKSVSGIIPVRALEILEQATPIDRSRLSLDRLLPIQPYIVRHAMNAPSAAGADLFQECGLCGYFGLHGAPPETAGRGLSAQGTGLTAADLADVPARADGQGQGDGEVVSAKDDRDAALPAGCKRRGRYRRHLALQHDHQHISGWKDDSVVLVAPLDDEAIRFEADMAPAGDLEDPFRADEVVGRGHRLRISLYPVRL